MKKILTAVAGLFVALVVAGVAAYALNAAPAAPAISAAEAVHPTKPFVVKLHAQWCATCMMTKGVWAEVNKTYAGKVNLLVLDFTNAETTVASRAEAKRLGLEGFLEQRAGSPGSVVIIDGPSKAVRREIDGRHDFADYRAAIEAALASAVK
jgi:thiol-disulfide isomerase/thioredoxin